MAVLGALTQQGAIKVLSMAWQEMGLDKAIQLTPNQLQQVLGTLVGGCHRHGVRLLIHPNDPWAGMLISPSDLQQMQAVIQANQGAPAQQASQAVQQPQPVQPVQAPQPTVPQQTMPVVAQQQQEPVSRIGQEYRPSPPPEGPRQLSPGIVQNPVPSGPPQPPQPPQR